MRRPWARLRGLLTKVLHQATPRDLPCAPCAAHASQCLSRHTASYGTFGTASRHSPCPCNCISAWNVLMLLLQLAHQALTRSAQLGCGAAVKRRDALRPGILFALLLNHVIVAASASRNLHPSIRQDPQCGVRAVLTKAVAHPMLHVPAPDLRAEVCRKQSELHPAAPRLRLQKFVHVCLAWFPA